MKVILQQDVMGQGKKGDMLDVSDGYARNFLIPKKMAVKATPEAMKAYERGIEAKKAQNEREVAAAKELAERLKEITVKLTAKSGSAGRLFGSVGNGEVAAAINNHLGIKLDKHDVLLTEPIKTAGGHKAKVKLGHGISAEVQIMVNSEG